MKHTHNTDMRAWSKKTGLCIVAIFVRNLFGQVRAVPEPRPLRSTQPEADNFSELSSTPHLN
jgi:hypothetical protein